MTETLFEDPETTRETGMVEMSQTHRVALLGGFVAYVLAASLIGAIDSVPHRLALIASLSLYVAMAAMPLVIWSPRHGWFHPLIVQSIFSVATLLRRFPMYAMGLSFHYALPGYNEHALNQLVALDLTLNALGIGFLYFGYYVGGFLPAFPVVAVKPRRFFVPAVISLALAALVLVVFVANRGGLMSHMTAWGGGRHDDYAGNFVFLFLASPATAVLWLWVAIDERAGKRPSFWLVTVLVLGSRFLLTGGRGSMVLAALVTAGIWTFRRNRLALVRGIFVVLLGIYAVGVLGYLRRSTYEGEVDVLGAFDLGMSSGIAQGGDELRVRATSAYGSLPILARVPSQVNHIYGETYFAALVSFVPRRLWPQKPNMVGGRVGRTFFATTSGVPPGAAAEAYWNLNVFGVCLVFLLHGVLLRQMVMFVDRSPHRAAAGVLLVVVLIFFRTPSSISFVKTLWEAVPVVALMAASGALRWGRGESRA